MPQSQISAFISDESRALLEAYVAKRGVKKGFLIEEALLHHLQALREIPEDVMIPVRLVLSDECMRHVADRLNDNGKPSPALVELLNGER